MTDYIEVLSGRSPKLADLCLQVEKEFMSDALSSKWATFGIHSVFLCKDRIAYQSEILLGAGVSDYKTISLWTDAGLAYLLYWLIYGPEDKYDRKVWKIVGTEPDYKAKIYTPMDLYVKFIWKSASELEAKLLDSDITHICTTSMKNAKYVSGKTDMSVYPAFAPDLSGIDLSKTITETVSAVADLTDDDVKKLPLEIRGEAKYCIRKAQQINGKVAVSTHPDARVSIYGNGEHIFDETLCAVSLDGLLPYDIARMRRILEQYDR